MFFIGLFVFCRYNCKWINDYKENLHKFFAELNAILPEETLVIWNLTMPLGERIKGGFLVPEVHAAIGIIFSTWTFDLVVSNLFMI